MLATTEAPAEVVDQWAARPSPSADSKAEGTLGPSSAASVHGSKLAAVTHPGRVLRWPAPGTAATRAQPYVVAVRSSGRLGSFRNGEAFWP
jgi:hypothetical protein